MNNLITKSDFKNPYMVFAGTPATESLLNDLIEFYQPEILRKILGELEYQNMVTDSNTDGTFDSDKWTYFVEGTTYTEGGVDYVYKGVKPVLCMFIYYYWQRETVSTIAERGAVKAEYSKIVPVVPAGKMAMVWNMAVDIVYNTDTYYPSVYRYLSDAYTFDDWDFTGFDKINPYL